MSLSVKFFCSALWLFSPFFKKTCIVASDQASEADAGNRNKLLITSLLKSLKVALLYVKRAVHSLHLHSPDELRENIWGKGASFRQAQIALFLIQEAVSCAQRLLPLRNVDYLVCFPAWLPRYGDRRWRCRVSEQKQDKSTVEGQAYFLVDLNTAQTSCYLSVVRAKHPLGAVWRQPAAGNGV